MDPLASWAETLTSTLTESYTGNKETSRPKITIPEFSA
jgi:hypothetical protein